MNKILLGRKVKDLATQFEGIAVARITYLNGCVRFQVQPPVKDGSWVDLQWIDSQQLKDLKDGFLVLDTSGKEYEIEYIPLGRKVKDKVTNFEGIATARIEYMSGIVQFEVTPPAKNGKLPNSEWIDVHNLTITGKGIISKIKKEEDTGGPGNNEPGRYGER